jgi:hypothetical protein
MSWTITKIVSVATGEELPLDTYKIVNFDGIDYLLSQFTVDPSASDQTFTVLIEGE